MLTVDNTTLTAWPDTPPRAEQRDFLADLDLPPDPVLVRALREYRHTGERVLRNDEQRALGIIVARVQGVPVRAICRNFRVAPACVFALMEIAEAKGLVETAKKQAARTWGRINALVGDAILESVAAGTMPVHILPTLAGIGTDKMLLLMGEATEIVAHKKDEDGPAYAQYLAERQALLAAPTVPMKATTEDESGVAYTQPVAAQCCVDIPVIGEAVIESAGGGSGDGARGDFRPAEVVQEAGGVPGARRPRQRRGVKP